MTTTELKPCPFCGSAATTYTTEGYMSDLKYIRCSMCEAKGPRHESEQYAIDLWNDRESPKRELRDDAEIAEIDRLFCEAYSNATTSWDGSAAAEQMHDAFSELLRRYRNHFQKGNSWQPIETAPKNTPVLVYFGFRLWVAYLTDNEPPMINTWRRLEDGTQLGWPTHWMSAPDAPTTHVEGDVK